MGQSGFDIMDSDAAMDIHYLYFEKYNAGKTPAEINTWVEESYKSNFQNKIIEDNSNFWLGLAMAQWQVKALTPFVLERVTEIVQTDIEKEDWEEEYPQRKKALEAFLKKIQKETKTAKKPVKQRLFKAPFEKGDVITAPFHDDKLKPTGKWGLAVCLESSAGLQKTAKCLFAHTLFEEDRPAVLEDIHSAYVNPYDWHGYEIAGAAICNMDDLQQALELTKIGKIEVPRSFAMDEYASGGWYFYSNERKIQLRDEKPELLHSLSAKEVVGIPDHPYSAWLEKIIFLLNLPYTEEEANFAKFKEVADFMVALRNENENEFLTGLIPFAKNYLVRDWDTAPGQRSPLRRIGVQGGYKGDLFE